MKQLPTLRGMQDKEVKERKEDLGKGGEGKGKEEVARVVARVR